MLSLTASSDVPLAGPPRRIAACAELIACAHDDDSVHVWSVASLAAGTPPLELAHPGPQRRRIDALALSEDGQLFVGSRELLALWRVRARGSALEPAGDVRAMDPHGMRPPESGLLPAVTCAAFQPRAPWPLLAVGLDETAHIFDTRTAAETVRLEGHEAAITACAWASLAPPPRRLARACESASAAGEGADVLLLITASEDRTFKLWDLRSRALAYSSAVLGASLLLAVAVDVPTAAAGGQQQPCRFAVGSEDGTVQLFEVHLRAGPAGGDAVVAAVRSIRMLTPHALLQQPAWSRGGLALGAGAGCSLGGTGAPGSGGADGGPAIVSSLPAWRRQARDGALGDSAGEEGAERTEASNAILFLRFVAAHAAPGGPGARHCADEPEGAGARGRRVAERAPAPLAQIPTLLVASCAQLLQIEVATFAVAPVLDPSAAEPAAALAAAPSAPLLAAAYLAPHRILVALRPFASALCLSIVREGAASLLLPPSLERTAGAAQCGQGSARGSPAGPGARPRARGAGAEDGGFGDGDGGEPGEFAEGTFVEGTFGAGGYGDGDFGGGDGDYGDYDDNGDDGNGDGWYGNDGREEGAARGDSDDDGDGGGGGSGRARSDARGRGDGGSQRNAAPPGSVGVTLRAAEAPPGGSPLARALALGRCPKPAPPAGGRGRRAPATAGRPVKSSGYGTTAPIMRLHSGGPSTAAARARRGKDAARAAAAHRDAPGGAHFRLAPYNPGRDPARFSPVPPPPDWVANGLHSSAALRLAYSPDGSRLASCAQNGSIALTRLPALRHNGESALLVGHTAAVRGLHWSHSGRHLISASDDGSACVWAVDPEAGIRSDAELRISHLLHEPTDAPLGAGAGAPTAVGARTAGAGRGGGLGLFGAAHNARGPPGAGGGGGGSASRRKNVPLGCEVRAARFYYLDQLVLLGCGPSLLVYSLALHGAGKEFGGGGGDARALTSCALAGGAGSDATPRYRLAHRWSPGAQHVTDVCAANDALSPIVLVAGSDKSLHAYDLHAGRPALSLQMAELSGGGHSRPIRSIALAPDSSDLALTAAADSTVRLWDLRAGRSVRCFSAHVNGHSAIGAAFSPCMRYVATGGEGRHASLYSLQSGSVVQTLGGHLDVVSDVAFHPRHPQLATACFDGRCRFWNNED